MSCHTTTSLNLNEEVAEFIRNRLETFGTEHPDCKFNINCWIDDLVTDAVKEVYDYLNRNQCPAILKKGGNIIGKSRAQFHKITKKTII